MKPTFAAWILATLLAFDAAACLGIAARASALASYSPSIGCAAGITVVWRR